MSFPYRKKLGKIRRALEGEFSAAWHGFPDWWASILPRLRSARASESDLLRRVRSDTVVIFGSGASLNQITPEQWATLKSYNTVGFNWFIHQKWIPCDYQLVKAAGVSSTPEEHRKLVTEYFETMRANANFDQSILVAQWGMASAVVNRAYAMGLLPDRWRVFPFVLRRGKKKPTQTLGEGLSHPVSTLFCALNFALNMPWKRVILAGVDLYDSRYFWLPPDTTTEFLTQHRNATATTQHNTIRNGVVDLMGLWKKDFDRKGIELSVLNPQSLLTEVLPVWNRKN